MEDFITTDMFTSLIGCVAITTAATQLLKQYILINFLKKEVVPIRILN